MTKNALLEAPIASDPQAAGSYHSSMDGNGQLRQAPPPAPHQWHQPYPAGPTQPYPATPGSPANRRWIPAAIISAGIIIAGAVVGGAVITNRGDKGEATSAPAGQTVNTATPAGVESSTCKAWAASRTTIAMIPALPQGWNYNTPNIDTYIGNKVTATNTALDLFVPRIAAEPADVAAAANDYVAAKRKELAMMTAHTYDLPQQVAVNDAMVRLNQVCGLAELPK